MTLYICILKCNILYQKKKEIALQDIRKIVYQFGFYELVHARTCLTFETLYIYMNANYTSYANCINPLSVIISDCFDLHSL